MQIMQKARICMEFLMVAGAILFTANWVYFEFLAVLKSVQLL